MKTHGKSYSKEYKAYTSMIDRCYNKNTPTYNLYGGRGIKVSISWLKCFENFYKDMGDSNGLSLDRVNNNKGYSKENCRWATKKEQANNRSTNRVLHLHGLSLTLSEWAYALEVDRRTLHERLRRGWSVERSLTEPLIKRTNFL